MLDIIDPICKRRMRSEHKLNEGGRIYIRHAVCGKLLKRPYTGARVFAKLNCIFVRTVLMHPGYGVVYRRSRKGKHRNKEQENRQSGIIQCVPDP
ncbi:hypothetical protein CF651_30475 [Paenibacillus rigui]|uniref:Uncharacterized protein n=1 Tax=Paenibacillus rigui TaxID=554312 RepID=A0A229UGM0_9BACL|nr:hypothetical protein CF651_30475 [Paenibacillus rigui]